MYYGTLKIKETKTLDDVATPNGYPIAEVTFIESRKNGDNEEDVEFKKKMPLAVIDTLATEEQTTATDLRDRHEKIVLGKLMDVLLEYDIQMRDIGVYLPKLILMLENIHNNAMYHAWYGDDTLWYPGIQYALGEVGIVEANIKSKKYGKDK